MPLLNIQTNVEMGTESRAELLRTASRITAEMLGKPEHYVMVLLRQEPDLSFGGTIDPAAYVELKSIGLPVSRAAEFSQILSDLLGQALAIPADRIYIEFSDAPGHLWGWNGGTF